MSKDMLNIYVTPFCSVSVIDFEQVNVCWEMNKLNEEGPIDNDFENIG